MKQIFLLFWMLVEAAVAWPQPRYDYARMVQEPLNRGVVAVRQADGRVFVGWRILRSDAVGEPFCVFRRPADADPQGPAVVQLNAQPIAKGGSFWVDEHPLDVDAVYEVRGGGMVGSFLLRADAPVGYVPVPLQKPDDGVTPDGRRFFYSANDASVGDVDGDGQLELVLKWEPSNTHDNAHDGYTGPTLLDCYRLSGERLWRIDLGPNIRSGAHYVPFLVYDFDGDGCAELMVKTADGTRDGVGRVLGDSVADYREPRVGRILRGPEYLTVFNGLTGAAMDSQPYVPERGDVRSWGDDRGNRSERYLAAAAYLDGVHASAVFCRGYYTRTVLAAWDWDGQTLKQRWTFDTRDPEWARYAGQGNHNLRVADVDGDGCDEITYGSMAVDHDGRGLYCTGFGHGDAIHLTAFDPASDRLQVWDCHENRRDGSDFRDAATGEVIFQIKSNTDVGRAMAADIDPTNRGVEMWSTDSRGIRNLRGEVVKRGKGASEDNTKLVIKGRYLPVNFGIWWDGDLLRELLDHETVYKYNWTEGRVDVVQTLDGCKFNNGTKSNPCLQADILGDWREEVIARNRESTELRIYVSTIPTPHRINCLLQDVPYRLSVVTQNVGYNQPPETGFYLGPDRTDYLKSLPADSVAGPSD